MKRGPLKHVSQRSRRELSMNGPGFHFNRNFVLSVDCVEVRHTMLIVEHPKMPRNRDSSGMVFSMV